MNNVAFNMIAVSVSTFMGPSIQYDPCPRILKIYMIAFEGPRKRRDPLGNVNLGMKDAGA